MRSVLAAGTLLGVWAAGLAAGILSGLFGVGGGILMVPAALYLVRGTDFHLAKAASLLVIVASAGVGVWTHHRRRSVDFRAGAILALGGIAGAAIAAVGVERIASATLTLLFGALLAITGARMMASGTPHARDAVTRTRAPFLLLLGIASGIIAGAFGVGGGIIIVPGLVLAGISIHLAIGTSLIAVLANAASATTTHLALGYGPELAAIGIPLALGAIPGTHLGARLAHRIHADELRRAFGAFLILAGLAIGIDASI